MLNEATAPAWSPDGRYLAYGQGWTGLVAIRTLATGATRTLWTGLPGAIMSLAWFPDLGSLAAQGPGPDGGPVGLRRIDLASGSLSDMLLGQGWRMFGANPTISPDGKSLVYKGLDTRQVVALTRYSLETKAQQVVLELKPPEYVNEFAVLPGTGQIAVALAVQGGQSQSIGLLDPSSGEARIIHRTPAGYYIPANISLAWMPDGKSLLFVTAPTATGGSPMSLFRIPLSGGQPQKLFEAETIWQVRVHPDGSQVAIDTRGISHETWVADNLFATARK